MTQQKKYRMVISRTTVEKLGIKLYDKVSSVVAELVSNAFDADAEKVFVSLPTWGRYLDTLTSTSINPGVKIAVSDNGFGMDSGLGESDTNEINEFYLKLGADARKDTRRGEFTHTKHRRRMGHKGIGKLAPFGICKKIEVITSGGKPRTIGSETGYLTSHFILDFDKINQDTDEKYEPDPGAEDGTLSSSTGTTIILQDFYHKMVPDKETFLRQLSRLFQPLQDFSLYVENREENTKDQVQAMHIDVNSETKRELNEIEISVDGKRFPLAGWIARAKYSYRNAEMAGVRIYARGRLAAVTKDFNIRSGFTGELTMRSYLVGEITADWLDEDDDLVNTGRQDILWDSDRGIALQQWGAKFLREWSSEISDKIRSRVVDDFMMATRFEEKAREKYPDNPEVVKNAIQFARLMGRSIDPERTEKPDEGDNMSYLSRLADFSLSMAPQKTVVEKLSEVLEPQINTLDFIVRLFNDASMAEAASLGEVARIRVEAIDKLDDILIRGDGSDESELQKLVEKSPWIIDPRWTVLQANRSFKTMKENFVNYYRESEGVEITVSAVDSSKRADFIFLPVSGSLKIVEIKKKTHLLEDKEFERIADYYEVVKKFLLENPAIKKDFGEPEILLICDGLSLSRTSKLAYEGLEKQEILSRKSWFEISSETKKAHEDFLDARTWG